MSGERGKEPSGRRAREAVRVACLMNDAELGHAVERLLRLWIPEVEISTEATGAVRALPAVDAILVDAREAGEGALEALGRVRAAGFEGAVVVVVPDAASGEGGAPSPPARPASEWRRLGGTLCPLGADAGGRLVKALADALDDAFARTVGHERDAGHGAPTGDAEEVEETAAVAALRRELRDTRRRLAIAEVALRLQHALNNPLAALLAEAQLLELEQLLPEHRTAVHRIVQLCRRMSETLRALDVAQGEAEQQRARTAPAPVVPGRGGGDWFGRGERDPGVPRGETRG